LVICVGLCHNLCLGNRRHFPCFFREQKKHDCKFGRRRNAVGTWAEGDCFYSLSSSPKLSRDCFYNSI